LEVVYAPPGSQYTAGQTIDLQNEPDNTLVLRNEPVSPNLGYYVLKPLDNFPISVTMFGSGGNGNPAGDPGSGPGGNAGAVTGTIPETYFIAGNNYKLYVGGSPTPTPAGGHGSAIVINGPGSPSTAFNPLDTTIMIAGGGGGGGGGAPSADGIGGFGGFPAGSDGTPGVATSPGPYAVGGNGGPGGTQSSGGVTPPQPLNPQGPAGGFYKNGYITGVSNQHPSGGGWGGGGGGYYSGASGNGGAYGGPIPGSGSAGGGGGGSNHANNIIVTSITEYSGPGIPGVPYFGTHGPFGIGGARGPSPAQTAGAIFVKLNLN